MPSVEMRRSTRVFVPKAKDGDLVKVLRSGRRLWGEINYQRSVKNELNIDDEWFPLIDDHSNYKPPQPPPLHPKQQHQEQNINRWHVNGAKPDPMDVDEAKMLPEHEKRVSCSEEACRNQVRVIKNVYSRKRKRSSGFLDGGRKIRKFGLHFVRRQKRKDVESSVENNKGCEKEGFGDENSVLSIVIEACAGCSMVSRLLVSVLKHFGKRKVDFTQLSAFLVWPPIKNVFASYGIHFFLGFQRMKNRVCMISGERQRMPLFTIGFAAIPFYFLGLHATQSLRSVRLSYLWWMNFHNENDSTHDNDEPILCTDGQRDQILSIPIAPDRDGRGMKIVVAGLEAGKVGSRIVHYRSGVLTRSSSKRRRRSLRNRRARNPLNFVMQKANGPPVANNVLFKKNGVQLPILDQGLRRSVRKNLSSKISAPKLSPSFMIKVPKSSSNTVINVPKPSSSSVINVQKPSPRSVINVLNSSSSSVGLNVDTDLNQCCSVNVLVVATDKCYRIEGAEVALDLSNEWVLAVRKDGITRYRLKVQKEMRPNTLNRFTHAVVWAAENGWKLEFPDRKDWVLFKELYKVCVERNIVSTSPVVKNIPVPGVSEVAKFWGSASAFERPESYIRMTSDELSRILSRRTANYDMDSEDEEWLTEFNRGLNEANYLSEDTFELMIDAFEKASYCSPEAVKDEKVAVSLCLYLASAEVTMLVYRYWTKRREQKRVPLLRVFELNEPRTQLITKPVLRKKRSLKRATASRPLQRGRGKDSSVLQAMGVEQTVLDEQLAVLRVQEVRASADKLVEVAILKRQRAQFLMENADLAMYQATMALRLADAATNSMDSQQAARHFLD